MAGFRQSQASDGGRPWHRPVRATAAWVCAALLTACGGGGGGTATDTTTDAATPAAADTLQQAQAVSGTTRADAFRLLTQASFGPTDADVAQVAQGGAAAWVDQQLAKPVALVHLARYNADDAAWRVSHPSDPVGPRSVVSSFYERALRADDQLRQRVAFALSEIFVVSLDMGPGRAQSVASWYDMLTANAFGNYRTLLRDASLHPAMGLYLSALQNRAADPATGRVPDQNYAREVMQLFSIGLHRLAPDGSVLHDGQGQPIDTYGADDIVGLSHVFTGFSWAGPDTSAARFWGQPRAQDALRYTRPMQGYAAFHSAEAKSFLGRTLAQAAAPPKPTWQRRWTPCSTTQRRPVHRPPADPAPGHQCAQPGLRGARVGGVRQQRRRCAR